MYQKLISHNAVFQYQQGTLLMQWENITTSTNTLSITGSLPHTLHQMKFRLMKGEERNSKTCIVKSRQLLIELWEVERLSKYECQKGRYSLCQLDPSCPAVHLSFHPQAPPLPATYTSHPSDSSSNSTSQLPTPPSRVSSPWEKRGS